MSREFRLQASLVLNVVLAVTVAVLALRKLERASAPSAREINPGKVTNEKLVFASQPKSPQYTNLTSPSERLRWLIDQLRAAGVPNKVLARVATSDFEERWEKRFAECKDGSKWRALSLEQDKAKDEEMRAVLGEDGYKQWDQDVMLREAGINIDKIQLTGAETNAIYDWKKKLQQLHWDLEQARLDGKMDDAEINDAYNNAYSNLTQQVKTLLGDDRYAQSMGMDVGTAAENLKQDLAIVSPSDSQFQDLLKAQQQWNQSRADLDKQFQDDPSNPDYADQIKTLDEARDQEYQRVLGTNAFDTLQKQQDPSYTTMKKYEDTWGLDDNTVNYVYDALKYYQKSVQDYQAQAKALEAQGQSVDWDAVNKNLQQFADQTQQSLQNSLGSDLFTRMQKNGVFQALGPSFELTGHAPPSSQ